MREGATNYIFDLYGTLVDIHTNETKPSLWERTALFYALHGAPYSAPELKRAYRRIVFQATEHRRATLQGIPLSCIEPDILSVFETLYMEKQILPPRALLADTALCFRTLSIQRLCCYEGAVEVIRALREKGARVYLLSNAQAAFTVPELSALGLLPLLDGMILSSDVGVKKPHPAIFRSLLQRHGLSPQDALMIGNDAEADILGAAQLGIPSRYIHTKQSPRRPDRLAAGCREIHSLFDLV